MAYWVSQHHKMSKKVQDTLNSITPTEIPSFQRLNRCCEDNHIKIKNGDRLEDSRRRFCNINIVSKFFSVHDPRIYRIDKRLLWNIDETSSACTKKLLIFANEGCRFTPTVSDKDFYHITAILPFNSNGDRLEPFVILPNILKCPQELNEFDSFLCTLKSGWMNKQIFFMCMDYISTQ